MSPHIGREPVVVSRKKPTGPILPYPVCSDWSCDDEEDWATVGPEDEDYSAIRREHDIACYHEPQSEWRARLEQEREQLSGGDPLWWGRPATTA